MGIWYEAEMLSTEQTLLDMSSNVFMSQTLTLYITLSLSHSLSLSHTLSVSLSSSFPLLHLFKRLSVWKINISHMSNESNFFPILLIFNEQYFQKVSPNSSIIEHFLRPTTTWEMKQTCSEHPIKSAISQRTAAPNIFGDPPQVRECGYP